MSKKSGQIRVGVIGAGGMGGRHARNIYSRVRDAKVEAIMDIDSGRAKAVATECGEARIFDDAKALIQDPAIDAVVIASPDPTHAELTMECMRQDKPVLCEKPLATTSEDAKKVVDEEVKLGRRLVQVGFMRHYDPQHVGVKQAVDAGTIGRPFLFKGFHRNEAPAPYVTGEAVIINAAIHDLDSCRWMLGQEIVEVYVRGANTDSSLGKETWDLQTIHLTLSDDCLGMIEVYVNANYGYEVGVEVVGHLGTVHTQVSEAAVVRRSRNRSQSIYSDWLGRFGLAYALEAEVWIQSLQKGGLTGPSAWDGYTSLLAAESCIQSMRSGLAEKVSGGERPELYLGL